MADSILIAEDNIANAQLMTHVLEAAGYHVSIAQDGWEVVDKAVCNEYVLILMDVNMPNLNGLEAAKIIRANEPAGCRVPIIALTADDDGDVRMRCASVGMDGHISKPIGPSDLVAAVASALAGRQASAA